MTARTHTPSSHTPRWTRWLIGYAAVLLLSGPASAYAQQTQNNGQEASAHTTPDQDRHAAANPNAPSDPHDDRDASEHDDAAPDTEIKEDEDAENAAPDTEIKEDEDAQNVVPDAEIEEKKNLPPGLTPPRPKQQIVPLYPLNAYDAEIEADVRADVELNKTGQVQDVTITAITYYSYDENGELIEEPGDPHDDTWGFIRAAKQAFERATWTPAIFVDDEHPQGVPRAVIVEQFLQFLWEEARLPSDDAQTNQEQNDVLGHVTGEQDEAPQEFGIFDAVENTTSQAEETPFFLDDSLPVNFEGTLVVRGTREPLAGVQIAAYREPDGPRIDLITDTDGRFAAHGLPAGTWSIVIDESEFEPFEVQESITEDEATIVTYRLRRTYFNEYRSETIEEPPAREVTRRTIQKEEIQRIPGANNDAIRAVQNMPGIARSAFSGGELIVRGSNSEDSGFYIDGMPVPTLFHFGALRAVIPTEFIDSLDFFPGNFGVQYGRATGGVLNINTLMRAEKKWHGHVDINVFDTGVYLEGPIAKNLTLQLGLRRSYIDAVLGAVKDVIPVTLTVTPRYYDYQARLNWKINASNKLSLMIFGSDDLADFVLEEQENLRPDVRDGFRSSQNFHTAIFRVDTELSDTVSNNLRVMAGGQNFSASVGTGFYINLDLIQLALRDEVEIKAHDTLTLRAGLDMWLTPVKVGLRAPDIPTEGQQMMPLRDMEPTELRIDTFAFQPGVYLEADYHPIEKLQIIPGLRLDYGSLVGKWSADARIAVRYHISDPVWLKAAVGTYHRPPSPYQLVDDLGNPELSYEQATQYSVGAEWQLTDALNLNVEAFYKDLHDLVSPSSRLIKRDDNIIPEIYNNEGKGRVYGAEFFLRHKMANHFFGWLTYTISRSERKDFGSDKWRPFTQDQTHILSLILSYDLPKNWSIGGRYRLISGNLYTPLLGATYNINTGTYVQAAGDTNSERLPLFHQLDIRADKRWVLQGWTLNVYLDIQNTYNRGNPEGITYSYDFRESAYITGLPFIPSFGIRGEF